jgi:hypothetical protein
LAACAAAAHLYFSLAPDRYMLRAMVRGWIGREEYARHHDAARCKA